MARGDVYEKNSRGLRKTAGKGYFLRKIAAGWVIACFIDYRQAALRCVEMSIRVVQEVFAGR